MVRLAEYQNSRKNLRKIFEIFSVKSPKFNHLFKNLKRFFCTDLVKTIRIIENSIGIEGPRTESPDAGEFLLYFPKFYLLGTLIFFLQNARVGPETEPV